MSLLRCLLVVCVGCGAPDRSPPTVVTPASAPSTPVAAPAEVAVPPVLSLALDAPGPTPPATSSLRFGVRWRAAIEAGPVEHAASQPAFVIGNEVFVNRLGSTIDVFDLATGARRRTKRVRHGGMLAAGGVLVVTDGSGAPEPDTIGLDKDKLDEQWRLPRSRIRMGIGDAMLGWALLNEQPSIQLRRAGDDTLVWELKEHVADVPAHAPVLVTQTATLYVPLLHDVVAAIDFATGKIRWRRDGVFLEASGDHVVIASPSDRQSIRIVDSGGRDRWQATGVTRLLLRDNLAYVTTSSALVAIDLTTNTVKWRRANTEAFGVSDTWLYVDANPEGMTVLDRDTGADAGHLPRDLFPGRLDADTFVLAFADRWLFAFGPVAAPDAAAMGDARGCLQITGCDADPHPPGAKVTINGATTTTDRRGCFALRTQLGLTPVPVTVVVDGETLELPDMVVFDGSVITLKGSHMVLGRCHPNTR